MPLEHSLFRPRVVVTHALCGMWYVLGVGLQPAVRFSRTPTSCLLNYAPQYSGGISVRISDTPQYLEYSGCLMPRLYVQYQHQPQALNTNHWIAVARSIVCVLGIGIRRVQ